MADKPDAIQSEESQEPNERKRKRDDCTGSPPNDNDQTQPPEEVHAVIEGHMNGTSSPIPTEEPVVAVESTPNEPPPAQDTPAPPTPDVKPDQPSEQTSPEENMPLTRGRRMRWSKPQRPQFEAADAADNKTSTKFRKARKRWRTAQMAEDYVSMVGRLMYPSILFGTFGHDPSNGRHPIERPSALGYFTHPLRRPSVIEMWSPFEIAKFEGAIAVHGKAFHRIQKAVETKTTKECVEFYYIWKKTTHYEQWKASYEPEFTFVKDDESVEEESSDEPVEDEKKKGRKRSRK